MKKYSLSGCRQVLGTLGESSQKEKVYLHLHGKKLRTNSRN
jgi:hypothetical protein